MKIIQEKKSSYLRTLIILAIIFGLFYYIKNNETFVKNFLGEAKTVENDNFKAKLLEIIENDPEVIVSAFEKAQQKKQAEALTKIKDKAANYVANIKEGDFSPVAGNPKGAINILYTFDYNCGYCKRENAVIAKLLEQNSDIALHYMPTAVLGKNSEDVTKLMIAVYFLNKNLFFKLHDNLMAMQGQIGFDEAKKEAIALGINATDLDKQLAKKEIVDNMNMLANFSRNVELSAVPQFIINGEVVKGAVPYEQLDQIISSIREKEGLKNGKKQ